MELLSNCSCGGLRWRPGRWPTRASLGVYSSGAIVYAGVAYRCYTGVGPSMSPPPSDMGHWTLFLYGVADVAISGGLLQSVAVSQGLLGYGLSSCGLSVDGTRIQNIRCRASGIDLVSSNSNPLLLLNGASRWGNGLLGVNQELIAVDFWTGRSATVCPSANQSIPNGVGTYLNQFNTTLTNDDSEWSSGAQDRLTVSRPLARVRIIATVTWAANPGNQTLLQIVKNTSAVIASSSLGNGPYDSLSSWDVPVVPGDYFQLLVQQSSGGAVNVLGASFVNDRCFPAVMTIRNRHCCIT